MVSNDEIKASLRRRKEGNGYLVCENCQGVYELQSGEKPDDFSDECECGGKLIFTKTISENPMKEDSRNKKIIRNGLIIFVVLFVLAIFILPLAYIGMMEITSNNQITNGNGQDYDEIAIMKSDYNQLNDQCTNLKPNVDASNNQNAKTAFINAKEDLVKANSDINDVDSALSAGKSQTEITTRINTAQSQLNTTNTSLARVKALI